RRRWKRATPSRDVAHAEPCAGEVVADRAAVLPTSPIRRGGSRTGPGSDRLQQRWLRRRNPFAVSSISTRGRGTACARVVVPVIPAHTVHVVFAGHGTGRSPQRPRTTSFNPAWTMRLRKRTAGRTVL